jgi:hypothetical protein
MTMYVPTTNIIAQLNYSAFSPCLPTTLSLAAQLSNQAVFHRAIPPHFGAWHKRPSPAIWEYFLSTVGRSQIFGGAFVKVVQEGSFIDNHVCTYIPVTTPLPLIVAPLVASRPLHLLASCGCQTRQEPALYGLRVEKGR